MSDCSESWLARAQAYWQMQGSGLTAVRRMICLSIWEDSSETFDAEALLKVCRKRDGMISQSTVYRTLRHLVQAGLLNEIEAVDGKRCYSIRQAAEISHSVLVCLDCQQVFPLENPCLTLRESKQVQRLGFSPRRIHLRIDSHCEQLRDTGSCERNTPS